MMNYKTINRYNYSILLAASLASASCIRGNGVNVLMPEGNDQLPVQMYISNTCYYSRGHLRNFRSLVYTIVTLEISQSSYCWNKIKLQS